ncbi:MAG TPA: methyltransferase domain-containing protein [Candidatus Polarisedimenticolaceae bacterium]|nr:methyltransferase domain-containing protein [Candidatus Polarisedimenticolaceae bacterium]
MTDAANETVSATALALPASGESLEQDSEWCVVDVGGRWRKIRFHDYDEIYSIVGLYEKLFYDVLKCSSPTTIRSMLGRCLRESRVAPGDLAVLDLGAGNGMVGEELAKLGIRRIVGVDIIPAAAAAARRDRGEIYRDYFVIDMTAPPEQAVERLGRHRLNCLTCVAALGFGDIPPRAFANAYNVIERDGWVAFNIKSRFLGNGKPGGFAGLIRRMIGERLLEVRDERRYTHRLATSGEPLEYTAFVGVKQHDVPAGWEM